MIHIYAFQYMLRTSSKSLNNIGIVFSGDRALEKNGKKGRNGKRAGFRISIFEFRLSKGADFRISIFEFRLSEGADFRISIFEFRFFLVTLGT